MNKILFVGKDFYPDTLGVSKYSTEMCLWLQKKNRLKVDVITGYPYYPEWKNKSNNSILGYRKESFRKLNIVRVPTFIPPNPNGLNRSIQNIIFSLSSLPIILFKLLFNRPSCLISIVPSYTNTFCCVILARIFRIKSFVHIQDLEFDLADKLKLLPSFLISFLFKLEKYILKNSYCVSSISSKMLKKIQEKIDIPLKKILFPNWINDNVIYPDRDLGQEFRNQIDIPQNTFLILYSGNIGYKQGFENLINAAIDLKKYSFIKFLIVGSGLGKKDLINEIRDNELDNCRIMPPVKANKLNQLLNSADLHIVLQKEGIDNYILPSKLTNIFGVGGEGLVFGSENSEIGNINNNYPGILNLVTKQDRYKFNFEKMINKYERSKINSIAHLYSKNQLNIDKIMSRYLKHINEAIN